MKKTKLTQEQKDQLNKVNRTLKKLTIRFNSSRHTENLKAHIFFTFNEFIETLKKDLDYMKSTPQHPSQSAGTQQNTAGHPRRIKEETADLIFSDLFTEKEKLQRQLLNLRALKNTQQELCIMDISKHKIFIYPEEIEQFLKIKIAKAKRKFENVNLECMKISLNSKEQRG